MKNVWTARIVGSLAAWVGLMLATRSEGVVVSMDRGFDYGATLTNNAPLGGHPQWSPDQLSAFLCWRSDGLQSPLMGGETGGAAYFRGLAEQRTVAGTYDSALTYSGYPQGSKFWFAALFRTEADGGASDTTSLFFEGPQADNTDVNQMTFAIDGTNARCSAFTAGGSGAIGTVTVSTGVRAGATHLFLARLTRGTPNEPANSAWDFWFDPPRCDFEASLGPAHASIAPSKGGRYRAGYELTKVVMRFKGWQGGGNPTWDEIRIGDDFQAVLRVLPMTTVIRIL